MRNKRLSKETLKAGKMTQTGRSILRKLQNNQTKLLDLFVRESIQNSLDAGYKGTEVIVGFNLGKFNKNMFINYLDGVPNINELYPNRIYSYLEVFDLNTVGLTGRLSYKDKTVYNADDNFLKLVYDIGKEQTQEGAGGSWGYGKSIYYRMGNGFVIFYSRIELDAGKYQERLAVVLIEDETKENTIFNYNKKDIYGVSWWGDHNEYSESIPIVDPYLIKEILNVFDIDPFYDEETGTRIIIPFVDEDNLIKDYSVEQEKKEQNYYDGIMDYLKDAVMRWYAPRINNSKYYFGKANPLTIFIDDKRLDIEDENPFFEIVQKIYNAAITKNLDELNNFINATEQNKFEIKEIQPTMQSTKLNNRDVGTLVYGKLTYSQLDMPSPYLVGNPYFLTNSKNIDDANAPIIFFTRQPGMIINYETISSNWTNGIPTVPKDEYVLGMFVLNSHNNIYIKDKHPRLTLEGYIRNSELSDHMSWGDTTVKLKGGTPIKPKIVERIQANIIMTLKSLLREKNQDGQEDEVTSHIADLFGSLIMPSSGKVSTPSGGGGPRGRQYQININYDEVIYLDASTIELEFTINRYNYDIKNFSIEVLIKTESKDLSLIDYEDQFNKKPIVEIDLVSVEDSLNTQVALTKYKTPMFGKVYKYNLETFDVEVLTDPIIGIIRIKTEDRAVAPKIIIKGVILYE